MSSPEDAPPTLNFAPPPEIAAAAAEWGGEDLAGKLERLVGFTLDAASRMNLTGDREPLLFWQRQIGDAFAAAQVLRERLKLEPTWRGRVIDVGSGAGMPGLAWALLWPRAQVDLAESRAKRSGFLRDAIAEVGIGNASVVPGRAETLAHRADLRERYDLATARGLAALPALTELVLPFVRKGGWLAAIKGDNLAAEAKSAQRALNTLGGSRSEMLSYTRPDGKACTLWIAAKARPTPAGYPRSEGTPEKSPL